MADLFKLDDREHREQEPAPNAPLAERLRPPALSEVVGQAPHTLWIRRRRQSVA